MDLQISLAVELKDKVLLHLGDIEAKFKRQINNNDEISDSPTKKRRIEAPTMDAYILCFEKVFERLAPMQRMLFFFMSDIPWCLDNKISLFSFQWLVGEFTNRHDKSLITNGDMVGIVAAQSCSERFTQTTLNQFHSTGMKKSAVTGMKRIKEILNGVKFLEIPTLGPLDLDNPEELFARTFSYYSDEHGIVYMPSLVDVEKYSPFLIFFKLNNKADAKYFEDIKNSFFEDDTVYVKSSKNNEMSEIRRTYRKITISHASGIPKCIDYDPEDKVLMFEPKTCMFKACKDAAGIVFNSCPSVDLLKMSSNDIYYIQETYGISAAETFIKNELIRTLGNEGININERHINLIASNMTSGGKIMPNTFGGVSIDDSVILKATFQESTKTFANAAANGLSDNIRDVSSQILLGVKPSVGTSLAYVYNEVGPIVETVPQESCPSPEYAEITDDEEEPHNNDYSGEYVPSSPCYAPASPYYPDEIIQPDIQI